MVKEEIKAQFDAAIAELKQQLIAFTSETKTGADGVRAETKAALDAAQARIEALAGEVKAIQKSADEAELRAQRMGFGAAGTPEVKTLGALVVGSAEFKALREANGGVSAPIVVKSFQPFMEAKALVSTQADGTNGFPVRAQRVDGVIAAPARRLRLRDLMVAAPTTSNAIEYVEETGFNHLSAALAAETAAIDTTITVDNASGFYAGQSITIKHSTPIVAEVASVDYDTNVITLADAVGAVVANATEVVSDTFVFTPETKLKPSASAAFTLKTEQAKTLAHDLPASRQVLDDADQLRRHVDTRLLEGVALMEETQILYGDGSARQLQGIMTHPRTLTYNWSDGETAPVPDTKLDAVKRGATLAMLSNYEPNAVVVHPTDWEDICLAKGSDGHYIFVNAPTTAGPTSVWGLNVIVTTAINAGEALIGAFGLGAQLWDRQMAMIRVFEQHADFAKKNMVLLLAEERMALTIYRPEAFVAVTFDGAPA